MDARRDVRTALCGLLLAALLGGAGAIAATGGAPTAPSSSAAASGSGLFGPSAPVGSLPDRIVATRVGILQALAAPEGHSFGSLTPGGTRFRAATGGAESSPAASASLGLATMLFVLVATLAHR